MFRSSIIARLSLLSWAAASTSVFAKEPEPFPVPKYRTYSAAEEARFLQDIVAHERIISQGGQFTQVIHNGSMTFKLGGVEKRAHFTKVMLDYLRTLDANNISMNALFAYDVSGQKVDSPHTRLGLWADPEEQDRYINHGVDITSFNRMPIAAFDPESTLTAVVSAIDNLPPGRYELGLPREAYPNDRSNANGSFTSDINKYFKAGKRNFNPDFLVWRMDLNKAFINEQTYASYRRFMPWYTNEVFNAKDEQLKADMEWMTPADKAALEDAIKKGNDVETVRYLMRDRSYGNRIADAMARAKKRGVSFRGFYGDALDHLHITVVEVTAPPTTPAPPKDAPDGLSALQEQAQVLMGSAQSFVPFTAQDLSRQGNPTNTRIEKLPNGGVRVRNDKGDVIYEANAQQWLDQLNAQEKHLTDLGRSARDAGEIVAHEIPTNVKQLREQLLNELNLNAPSLLSKVLDPLPNCPQINASRIPSSLLSQSVRLPDSTELSFGNFLDRVADTQSVLCSLGFSMLDQNIIDQVENLASAASDAGLSSIAARSASVRSLRSNTLASATRGVTAPQARAVQDIIRPIIEAILAKRDQIFDNLGLSGLAKALNLEAFNKLGKYGDIVQDITDVLNGKAKVGPEMLNDLKNTLGVKELADKIIPNMPDFQLPGKPKRTPLNVKKSKRWDGLNMGKRDIIAMEGFAELVMGGTEESETLRADAQSNFYVFGKDINILDALGELTAAPQGVSAHLHMRIIGKDLFTPIDAAGAINLQFENPNAFTFKKQEGFKQTFQIGPIPVAVEAGGVIDLGLGYRLGIVTTQVQGAVVPHAAIGGYAQAGVGFSGFLSAGAGAEITVLKFDAPVTGGAKLLFDEEGYPFLRIFIDTDCSLELLNGRVYAYAEFPVPFDIKKETMDIWKFKGPQFKHKIMSWSIDVGHQGSKMGGDILDQADEEQVGKIQLAISLDNRKEELEAYRKRLRDYADATFQNVTNEVSSDAGREMAVVGAKVEGYNTILQTNLNNFSNRLGSM